MTGTGTLNTAIVELDNGSPTLALQVLRILAATQTDHGMSIDARATALEILSHSELAFQCALAEANVRICHEKIAYLRAELELHTAIREAPTLPSPREGGSSEIPTTPAPRLPNFEEDASG
jgi:hypothetical protein